MSGDNFARKRKKFSGNPNFSDQQLDNNAKRSKTVGFVNPMSKNLADYSNYKPKPITNIKSFEAQLGSSKAITAWLDYVNLDISEQESVVEQFFEFGGQLSTLLSGMQEVTQKQALQIRDYTAFFNMCRSILMIIARNENPTTCFGGRGLPFAIELCRVLLDDFMSEILKALSSKAEVDGTLSVLRLLTVMVTMPGSDIVKMVVTKLDWNSEVWINMANRAGAKFFNKKNETTVKITGLDINIKDSTKIRKYYIHFLLSFLLEPVPFVLKEFFERKTRLSNIFDGLIYDEAETVLLVLETLRTKVVECPHVLKTYKMKLFSSYRVLNLFALERWQGELDQLDCKAYKGKEQDEMEIRTSLFSMLEGLFTSFKFGVVFQDDNYGCGKSNNILAAELLRSMTKNSGVNVSRFIAKLLATIPGLLPAWLNQQMRERTLNPMGYYGNNVKYFYTLSEIFYYFYENVSVQKIVDRQTKTDQVSHHILKKILFPELLIDELVLNGLKSTNQIIIGQCLSLLEKMLTRADEYASLTECQSVPSELETMIRAKLPELEPLMRNWQTSLVAKDKVSLNAVLAILGWRIKYFNLENESVVASMFADLKKLDEDEIKIDDIKENEEKEGEMKTTVKINIATKKTDNDDVKESPDSDSDDDEDKMEVEEKTDETKEDVTEKSDAEMETSNEIKTETEKPDDEKEVIEGVNPMTRLLFILTSLVNTDKRFASLFISVETLTILLNCLSDKSKECFKSARKALVTISMNSGICLFDALDIDILIDLVINDARLVPHAANVIWNSINNAKSYEQEIVGISNDDISENSVEALFTALLKNDPLPISLKATDNEIASPLILSILTQDVPEEMKDTIVNYVECYIGTAADRESAIKIVKPRCDLISVDRLDLSLKWLTAESPSQIGLKKVHASKLANSEDDASLNSFLEDLKNLEDQKSVVQHLFRRNNFNNFNLFSSNKTDVLQTILPYVQKFGIDCQVFGGKVMEQSISSLEGKKFRKFDAERVMNIFKWTEMKIENLFEILDKLSEKGVNKLVSEDSKLTVQGCLLVASIQSLANPKHIIPDDNYQIFSKLSSHFEYILEKTCEDYLGSILANLIRLRPLIADKLAVNTMYVLTQKLSRESSRELTLELVKNSEKVSNALLEWLSKVKNETVSEVEVLLLVNHLVTNGCIDKVISHKKAIKNIVKKITNCITNDISKLYDSDDNETSAPETAMNIIKTISTNVSSSKAVSLVQTFFSENKEQLKKIVSDESLTVRKRTGCIEFAHHILNILGDNESALKKHQLNYVLIPIIQVLPPAMNAKDQDRAAIISLCKIGLEIGQGQTYTAVRKYLMKNKAVWSSLIKCILRHGLKDEEFGNVGLPLLCTLCSLRYNESAYEDADDTEDLEEMNMVVDMIVSHSAYLNILLADHTGGHLKERLADLLVSLAPASCRMEQLDPILASYTGTLHPSDTALLRLLYTMESNGVSVNIKAPIAFGPTAVRRQLLAEKDIKTPNHFADSINAISTDIIKKTYVDLPLDLPLDPLENYIVSDENLHDLYDPRFVLPLFSSLFSEDAHVYERPYRVVNCQVISLAMRCLSSDNVDMRNMACHTLHKIYTMKVFSLEYDKQLWMHVIDMVRYGLTYGNKAPGRTEEERQQGYKLTSIISLFLAHSCSVLVNRRHFMNKRITGYLLKMPVLDFYRVPMFLSLFHSSEFKPKQTQAWILTIVRDGLVANSDHWLLQNHNLYKFLLCNATSSLVDKEILMLILEIIEKATRLSVGATFLTLKSGLIPWLHLAMMRFDDEKEFDLLVKIYTNTKKALQAFITEKDATKEAEPDNYNDDNDETKVESYAARRLRMATTACSNNGVGNVDIKMLKTSRSRALDTGRPIPVYHEEDVQDVDIQPVRGLQYVVTGMEKAEEDEKHLQEILTAQVLGLQKHQEDLIIPTPEYSEIVDYDDVYKGNARKYTQYIHAVPFFHEDYPVYDLDEEDVKFIKDEINEKWKLELSHTNFEQMVSQLERNCGSSTITLNEAKLILKEDDDLILLVYEYWLKKKLRQQHNLIPLVRSEKVGCNADKRNPYVAFRRRFEKMQTRKNRKLDENNYVMMLKLRRDLSRVVTLLGFLKKRERLKKAGLELDLDVVERRVNLTDWDSRIINEIHASRKYKKLEEYARNQEVNVASEDDFSTVDSDYESADEGPFQFRRKEGVQYLAPTDWSENEDTDSFPSSCSPTDKYLWTYVPDICVSYARRRVGRGGRVILDRAPPCKRLKPGHLDNIFDNKDEKDVFENSNGERRDDILRGIVHPELEADLQFVDWDPYRWSQHDESQEVARIMAATSIVPACNSSSSEIRRHQATPPNSLWRRQRYSSGSMKTINMNKVGAHNAASALINNQFIDLFSVSSNNSDTSSTNSTS